MTIDDIVVNISEKNIGLNLVVSLFSLSSHLTKKPFLYWLFILQIRLSFVIVLSSFVVVVKWSAKDERGWWEYNDSLSSTKNSLSLCVVKIVVW